MLGALFQVGVGTGSGAWTTFLNELGNLGVFLYILPFLLALAVFYGILMFVFKDKMPKSAVGIISLVLAFFVMLYTSYNTMIVAFFANLGGSTLVISSGILVVAIFLGLMGFHIEGLTKGGMPKWVFILGIIAVALLVFFGAGAGSLIPLPAGAMSTQFQVAIFFIVILALAMWWLGGGKEEGAAGGGKQKAE
jgi:hypothetical protein